MKGVGCASCAVKGPYAPPLKTKVKAKARSKTRIKDLSNILFY